jgi:hypothetical protein
MSLFLVRRKTDFFSGPPGSPNGSEAAIEKVNQVLQKHAKRYQQDQGRQAGKKSKPAPAKKKSSPKKTATQKKEDDVIEMDTDGGFDVSDSTSAAAASAQPQSPSAPSNDDNKTTEVPNPKSSKSNTEPQATTADIDKGKKAPPPLGNGGTVDGKYIWTQTLSELSVTIPVPDNTRGRNLSVTIARKHLKIGLSKQSGWIVDAPLSKPVICDDSFWTVEDGNRLVINLQKLNQMEWWESVCQGDPIIDIKTIQPENSSLGDLDGETRKTVEKMMFDQRQKALGLPSSDEQEKLNAIDRFKQQHPELDFSNAKIN